MAGSASEMISALASHRRRPESLGIADSDLAFAYEALARACALAGDTSEARRWAELARAACAQVTEDDDNEIVLSDLETLPAGIWEWRQPPARVSRPSGTRTPGAHRRAGTPGRFTSWDAGKGPWAWRRDNSTVRPGR